MDCDSLDIPQFLVNFREAAHKMARPDFDELLIESEAQNQLVQEFNEFRDILQEDLGDERMQAIRDKIYGMKEDELNKQVFKLELAVLSLGQNSIYDKLASEQAKFENYSHNAGSGNENQTV